MNRELQSKMSMVRQRLSQLELGDMAESVEMVAELIDTMEAPQDIRDTMEATLFMKETNEAEYDALKRVLDKWEKKSGKKSEAKNEEIEISTKEVEKIISREKIKSKTNIDPEEMDRVDLSFIISRRGKEWIKKEINDAH